MASRLRCPAACSSSGGTHPSPPGPPQEAPAEGPPEHLHLHAAAAETPQAEGPAEQAETRCHLQEAPLLQEEPWLQEGPWAAPSAQADAQQVVEEPLDDQAEGL